MKSQKRKMAKQENEKIEESNKNMKTVEESNKNIKTFEESNKNIKTVEEVVYANQRGEALVHVESKSSRNHVNFHIDEWYLHDCLE